MKIKVLIADDNSFIREGMRIILTTFGDFEVVATVGDGQEAVDYCKAHEVDIALLDVRMPNMNGVEATRRLTEETKTRPLILTTFDDDEYILDAIRYGAKGYLLKNNDPERIRDAIKSVHSGNNVLQDVVLDKLKSSMDLLRPEKERQAAGGPQTEARAAGSAQTGSRVSGDLQAEAAAEAHQTGEAPLSGRGSAPALASPSRVNESGSHAGGALPFDRSPFTDRELDVMSKVAQGLSNKEISKELFISEGTTANYITSILNKTALEHRTQIAIYYLTGRVR
ncbi:response regulator transcription factor [Paenibacillus sp. YPG26]|uniref:response regulator transcription factor n=1 Tax=Paenibacillus sp. YPG26 TaxID=2878915 RepID=UPI00203B5E6C|nr:response regulator transcription factor [Paenibacillus sp. YPG26]USB34943.1 response regulator transcription factor [Paenibacillus sp. YPG26]